MKALLFLIVIGSAYQAIAQSINTNAPTYRSIPSDPSSTLLSQSFSPPRYLSGGEYMAALDKIIPAGEKHNTPEFIRGYLLYTSGKQSPFIRLNYNRFYNEIQFIDEKGDTLLLAYPESVKYVITDKEIFYRHVIRGYFRVLEEKNVPVKLMDQQHLKLIKRQTAVEKTPNFSDDKLFSVTFIPKNPQYPNEKVVFSKKRTLYLMDKYERFFNANKSGFLKAFPNHREKIKDYIKTESIKFSSEEDLRKLLEFCSSLK